MSKSYVSLAGFLILLSGLVGCRKELSETPNSPLASTADAPLSGTQAATVTRYINVNVFGGANAFGSTEWNNWNASGTLSFSALKYNDGTASAVKATLSQQTGISDNGPAYAPTMVAKEVLRYASYSTSNRTLTLSGLDNAKNYDLTLFASRSGASGNTTRFTIGSKVIDIKTDNNLTNKAEFSSIQPASGSIVVKIDKLNSFNYLNGFTIIERGASQLIEQTPAPAAVTDPSCNSGAGRVFTLLPTSGREIYLRNAASRGYRGGDTLRIPSGDYSLIDLGGLSGDACRPLVIINQGGPVRVGLIRLGVDQPATFLRLTGTGTPGLEYGFVVGAPGSVGVAAARVHHLEVDHLSISQSEVGIYIKRNPVAADPSSQHPAAPITDLYIHHNYLSNIRGEGMYLGHTYPAADPYNQNLVPLRMERVEVAYNRVEGTDWDGIQLSNARGGNKIHHNQVRDFGRINKSSQQAGIILGGNTQGDIYQNEVVKGTGNGIQCFGYGTVRIYQNLIEDAGKDGTAQGQEAFFANDYRSQVEQNPPQQVAFDGNTIKNPTPRGAIRIAAYNQNSLPSSVKNNVLTIPNAPANWLQTYIICNVPNSTITGNTLR